MDPQGPATEVTHLIEPPVVKRIVRRSSKSRLVHTECPNVPAPILFLLHL